MASTSLFGDESFLFGSLTVALSDGATLVPLPQVGLLGPCGRPDGAWQGAPLYRLMITHGTAQCYEPDPSTGCLYALGKVVALGRIKG